MAQLFLRRRRGFSLLEMVLVIGILGVVSSATIPMYRKYQISSDLNNAQALITQGISRARQLAQSGKNDDAWGFSAQYGTLYEGTSYASRVNGKDELYTIPTTITVSGITDVSFQKITGTPSANGNITLSAFDGEQRLINIAVSDAGIAMNTTDLLVICHDPHGASPETQYISDADLPTYLALGDTSGPCPVVSSSSSSRASSVASSSAVSSAASSVSSAISSGSSAPASSVASSAGGGGGSSSNAAITTVTAGILLLEPIAQSALYVSGNAVLNAGGMNVIMLNTSNPYGILVDANGNLSASHIYTYGSPGYRSTSTIAFNSPVINNVAPVADPYAALPVPSVTSPAISPASFGGNTAVTLSPGAYSSGIKATVNAKVTLQPGTYYLGAGGLTVANNAYLTGVGVTIYNTGGGSINISGNGVVDLEAPSSGTYKGVVIYQDRTYNTPITITGNGNLTVKGAIYAPKAPITLTGNGSSNTMGSLIVGLTLKVTGNGTVKIQ